MQNITFNVKGNMCGKCGLIHHSEELAARCERYGSINQQMRNLEIGKLYLREDGFVIHVSRREERDFYSCINKVKIYDDKVRTSFDAGFFEGRAKQIGQMPWLFTKIDLETAIRKHGYLPKVFTDDLSKAMVCEILISMPPLDVSRILMQDSGIQEISTETLLYLFAKA